MKYQNEEAFLDACNNDKNIKPMIDNGFISVVTKNTLKQFNIKQKVDGYFYYSQIFELLGRLQELIKSKHGENSLRQAVSKVKEKSEHYDKLSIIKLIEPESPKIKRFLLATLSNKFNNEIKLIRKTYGIPEDGFDLELRKEEYEIWVKKMKELAEEELRDKTDMDYVIENKISGHIFGEKGAYSDNIFTSLGKLKKDTLDIFWKYNIRIGFVPSLYVSFGLSNKAIAPFINDINNATPFQISTRWKVNDEESVRIQWANPNKFGIFIDRPVTKEALIEYINNSKNFKDSLNEYYKHVELNDNMQRDWLIYQHRKLGFKNKDIPTALKEYGFNEVTSGEVKIIISRLNARISKFEEVTQ